MSEVEVEKVAVTSVREAIKAAGAGKLKGLSAGDVEGCAKLGAWMDDHPFKGGIVQSLLLHKFHRDTGKDIVGAIDWQAFLDWLKNGGLNTIMSLILTLIGLL